MTGYDIDADRQAIDGAAAPFDAEENRLLQEVREVRRRRDEAVAAAARWKPGDRILYRDHRTVDPQEWEIASAHSSGYPGSGLYRGRRIRKDGQPSDRPATALYPTRILGPAPPLSAWRGQRS